MHPSPEEVNTNSSLPVTDKKTRIERLPFLYQQMFHEPKLTRHEKKYTGAMLSLANDYTRSYTHTYTQQPPTKQY